MRHLSAIFLTIVTAGAVAQVPRPASPPPPAKYEIEIRYRIDAFRNERAKQFKDMTDRLKAMGFERDPEDDLRGEQLNEIENSAVTRMKGIIPSAKVREVLTLRPVLSVLARPAEGMKPMGGQAVRVDLELAGDLAPSRQRVVAAELGEVLRKLGFRQPIGYDHRGYTRLLGVLPANQLEAVLNDVRRLPASWDQLSKTLLSDLRRMPGGANSLNTALEAWNADPEGGKLVQAVVESWVVQEPGYRLVGELPALVVNDSTLTREVRIAALKKEPINKDTQARLVALVRENEVVREQLLAQLQQHPQGAPVLEKLQADVMKSPAGSRLMDILLRRLEGRDAAAVLPQLFRSRILVRLIEARTDLPLPDPRPPAPTVPEEQLKIGASLRPLLKDAMANNPRRLDVILNFSPRTDDTGWQTPLFQAAPSLVIEGRLGSIVSVRCKPSEALALAKLVTVAAVRLPREASSAVLRFPDEEGDEAQVLKATGIAELLRDGKPQRPVRVAVIDSDFRGWQELVRKKLPFTTRLLDLTAERNNTLKGDPFTGPAESLGNGTLIAMAVAKAAPWCELVLVRIDAGAPHMIQLVHRRLLGREEFGDSLLQRRTELYQGRLVLNRRHEALLKEREEVLNLFADDKNQNDELLKKRQARLEAYRKDQEKYDADEKAFGEYEKTYLTHLRELRDLRDVRVVVCGLNWNAGLPVDGGGHLARLMDDTEGGRFLWVQAAGHARGQAWTGVFRDGEKDGVMEFAPERAKVPARSWNHDSAFLAWQPWKGARDRMLPAKTRVRLTLQWREAQNPDFARAGEDPYRAPLTSLRLMVIRQPDPDGKTRPADDLSVVDETAGLPERISVEAGSTVYEHVLEMSVDAAARLALRVEGFPAKTTQPPGTVDLPALRTVGELKPRIFIETLEGEGRVVFEAYSTPQGETGTPTDSARGLAIGALDAAGKPRSYSTAGTPASVELSRKPDLSTFDRLGLDGAKNVGGSAMSAGLVAGYAANLLGHGTRLERVVEEVRKRLSK